MNNLLFPSHDLALKIKNAPKKVMEQFEEAMKIKIKEEE
jgi:hypothetical protein